MAGAGSGRADNPPTVTLDSDASWGKSRPVTITVEPAGASEWEMLTEALGTVCATMAFRPWLSVALTLLEEGIDALIGT